MKEQYFFPYRWKILGWVLVFAGMVMAVMFIFFDFRFSMPVFAVFSSFIETKYLTIFRTNFADELTLFLIVGGFFLVVFSREKDNHSEQAKSKALLKALYYNSLLIIFSILFIYGQGFVGVLIINLFSIFIFYLLFLHAASGRSISISHIFRRVSKWLKF